jgi:hypothetical protein
VDGLGGGTLQSSSPTGGVKEVTSALWNVSRSGDLCGVNISYIGSNNILRTCASTWRWFASRCCELANANRFSRWSRPFRTCDWCDFSTFDMCRGTFS